MLVLANMSFWAFIWTCPPWTILPLSLAANLVFGVTLTRAFPLVANGAHSPFQSLLLRKLRVSSEIESMPLYQKVESNWLTLSEATLSPKSPWRLKSSWESLWGGPIWLVALTSSNGRRVKSLHPVVARYWLLITSSQMDLVIHGECKVIEAKYGLSKAGWSSHP